MMYTIANVFTQGKSMSSLADQIEWVAKTYPVGLNIIASRNCL